MSKKKKEGEFLDDMPHTHRNCTKVNWSNWRRYSCKVNKEEFINLDEPCQFERENNGSN